MQGGQWQLAGHHCKDMPTIAIPKQLVRSPNRSPRKCPQGPLGARLAHGGFATVRSNAFRSSVRTREDPKNEQACQNAFFNLCAHRKMRNVETPPAFLKSLL